MDLQISSVAKVHFNMNSDIILVDLRVSFKAFYLVELFTSLFTTYLDLETTVGFTTGTQIPPFKDAWKVPMAVLGSVLKFYLLIYVPESCMFLNFQKP